MDTNKLFSFQRIAMVMKRDFLENWKTNLYRFAGMYGAFLVVYIYLLNKWDLISHNFPPEGIVVMDSTIAECIPTFVFIAAVVLLYAGSRIMEPMGSKEMRTSYLMLPATSLEKFIARSLTVTIGVIALLFVAMWLAELSHFILMPLFDIPDGVGGLVLPELWKGFWEIVSPFNTYSLLVVVQGVENIVEKSNVYNFIAVSSICLWIHSFSILGGNVWYKHAFVKTAITFLIFWCIVAYVWVELVEPYWWMFWMKRFNNFADNIGEDAMLCIVTAFFFAWTCFNWWLAYRLFTRSQVIKPKSRLL